jgi:hypothetical protein
MSTIKTETLSTPSNATVPVDTVVNGTAKAWVNFNGTTADIRRAFNVSTITDNAAGDYTVNFTTAMPDANYSPVTAIQFDQAETTASHYLMGLEIAGYSNALQTTSARFWGKYGAGTNLYNQTICSVIIFS